MDQYWASLPKEDLAAEMMGKVTDYRTYLETSNQLQELRKSYRTYYGTTDIRQIDQSLKAIYTNHYANLIRHILVDVNSQRPSWEPRAVNTDLESQSDTQLASGLLDYYMREKHIETKLNSAVETCLYLKEGWVSVGWDVTGGNIYGTNPDSGDPIYEGDVEVKNHIMLDITRDVRRRDMNHDWYIIREYANKYDIASQYPELAEDILALAIDTDDDLQYELNDRDTTIAIDFETDLIPVYTLMHEKTQCMPQGRLTKILSADVVLFDGPLPYKRMYLFPVGPAEKSQSAFMHSYTFDMLPLQDAFDGTISAIYTNQAANAIQNFQGPKGASPNVTLLENGMNYLEYDPKAGKIERLDLLGTAPEVFNFASFLQGQMELLSAVSQISRGAAPANMSGTAMALLAQQSIQFSSGVQLSRTLLLESVGTAIIELLQTFAVVPRIAMIVGKSKRPMMKTFKGDDLNGISRVIVDSGNALMNTSSGRLEVANNLLQVPGMISTPEQYIDVLTTGNLEPLYERDRSQLSLIRGENEKMMDGDPSIQAFLTDNHPMHILEHSVVLDSPEARMNPQVVQAVQSHIQQHLDIAKQMPPELSAMLKQQSFYQAPPPPPAASPVPNSPPGAAQVMDPQNPVTKGANNTPLPQPAQPPGAFKNSPTGLQPQQ